MYDFFGTPDEPSGLSATTVLRPGGVRVVTLVGDIDAATVDHFADVIATGDHLIVDLTRVEFLGCAGVRCLCAAALRAARLAVVCTGHGVRRSLEVTGADRVLEVHDSTAAALASRDAVPGMVNEPEH